MAETLEKLMVGAYYEIKIYPDYVKVFSKMSCGLVYTQYNILAEEIKLEGDHLIICSKDRKYTFVKANYMWCFESEKSYHKYFDQFVGQGFKMEFSDKVARFYHQGAVDELEFILNPIEEYNILSERNYPQTVRIRLKQKDTWFHFHYANGAVIFDSYND